MMASLVVLLEQVIIKLVALFCYSKIFTACGTNFDVVDFL